jgi:activator of 2-hydroxyglutaryl-CoA dehydratase
MSIEKVILAVLTTNPKKAPSGIAVFHCSDVQEMYNIGASLEAILDGIAHKLTEEIMIIVKH